MTKKMSLAKLKVNSFTTSADSHRIKGGATDLCNSIGCPSVQCPSHVPTDCCTLGSPCGAYSEEQSDCCNIE